MKMSPRLASLSLAFAFAGCAVVELDFYATATGGTGSTSTSTASGMTVCSPGETRSCYSGPAGTEGQGICAAGAETCAADGMSWGACVGEVLPQAENCATPEDEDCDGKAPPCKGALVWAKRFGDTGTQFAAGVAMSAAGDVLLTGAFTGVVNFGGGPLISAGNQDAFLVKLDAGGTHVWSKRFGDSLGQAGASVAVSALDEVLLAGAFFGQLDLGSSPLVSKGGDDVFIGKFASAGGPLWRKSAGDATLEEQAAYGIVADASGNVFVTGVFSGQVDFGGGPMTSAGSQEIFLVKLDPTGSHVWSKHFGNTTNQPSGCLAVDSTGNVILTGSFSAQTDLGSGPQLSAGGQDAFVAKFDPSGVLMWARYFGSAGDQTGVGVATDSAGAVIVTGAFTGQVDLGGGPLVSAGGTDIFLAKFNAGGDHQWSKSFGDTGDEQSTGVAADGGGNVLLAGSFAGQINFGGGPLASAGGQDVFLAKFGASGDHSWSQRFGDASDQTAAAVAMTANGESVLAGYFEGGINFGEGSLMSAGLQDIFVAKFAP